MRRSSQRPAPSSARTSARSWRGWWRFLLIGLGGFLALTGGVVLLVELAHVGKRPAYAVMITLVMVANFYANRRYVFPAGRTGAPARQAIRFFLAAITFRFAEYALYALLIGPLATPYVTAIVITSALAYGVKYYVFSAWVFR